MLPTFLLAKCVGQGKEKLMTEENKQVIERAVVGLRTAAAHLEPQGGNNEKFAAILRVDATNLEKLTV